MRIDHFACDHCGREKPITDAHTVFSQAKSTKVSVCSACFFVDSTVLKEPLSTNVYGLPCAGKTTVQKLLADRGYKVLDTDYPHSMWESFGLEVPDVVKPFEKIKSTTDEAVKAVVRARLIQL